ncbi:type II secretion system protein GspC [Hydrogenivirga sp.]
MNWVVLSLPLIASLSSLLATAGLYIAFKESFRDVKVPELKREEPDIAPVKEAFAKVFPQPKVNREVISSEPLASPDNIELLGTAVGVKSLALLKVNGKTFVLQEGGEKRGVRLKRVSRRMAVVEVGGKEYTLVVKAQKISLTSGGVLEPSFRSSSDLRISRREIERLTRDPGVMFREIRLVPYVKNGKTEGFIFEWIKPGSLFYKVGLRKGDILVSINNMTIRSGEDAFRVLQVLRNEPSLRVVVMRGGQKREITVRIE